MNVITDEDEIEGLTTFPGDIEITPPKLVPYYDIKEKEVP
jgi:hypothetical protein